VMKFFNNKMEDTLKNGVKKTVPIGIDDDSIVSNDFGMNEAIQNGVKHTEYGDWEDGDERLDDIIENGIKETHDDAYHHTGRVEGVIKKGIKKTNAMDEWVNTEFIVDGVISKRVKKSPI
jgi:hypothetical protein